MTALSPTTELTLTPFEYEKQIEQIRRVVRQLGSVADYGAAHNIPDYSPDHPQHFELGNARFGVREHQIQAWRALAKHREQGNRAGLIELATGLGKTTVAVVDAVSFADQFYKEHGRQPRIGFVVHQNTILDQASERFAEFAPHLMQGYYAGGEKNLSGDITFATFQSLYADRDTIDPNQFDYLIFDEAHHAKADSFSSVVDQLTPQFTLALTATPDRSDDKDIRDHFGEVIYRKTLAEALGEGLLTRVDYSIITDKEIERIVREGFQSGSIAEINDLLSNNVSRAKDIAIQIRKELKEREREDSKMIIFCSSVDHANEMAGLMSGEAYHSNLPEEERNNVLARFKSNDTRVICAVDMLNEGVDVPDADTIIFLRSTASDTIFRQQLGRGLRLAPGKDKVTVLDFVANIERLVQLQQLESEVKKAREIAMQAVAEQELRSGGERAPRERSIVAEPCKFTYAANAALLLEQYLNIRSKREERLPLPASMAEAAERWKQYKGDEEPIQKLINQASKEGWFCSVDWLNKLSSDGKSGLNELKRALGFEVKARLTPPASMAEAAERWKQYRGDVEPVYKLIAQASKEGWFCSHSRLNKLSSDGKSGFNQLKLALGFEVKELPQTMTEAAERWREHMVGVEPTQKLINQASREGWFCSVDWLNKLSSDGKSGLNELKLALGFEVKELPQTITEAAERWKQYREGIEPTRRLIDQASGEGWFCSIAFLNKLSSDGKSGLSELKFALGFSIRIRKK